MIVLLLPVWFLLDLNNSGVLSFHIRNFTVPTHAIRNERVVLHCDYDLGAETLYSVKWYKDGNEFFRYVPRDMPPTQDFPVEGLKVDMQNSTHNSVILSSVDLTASGIYKCEVSGEAPFFETVIDKKRMSVVVLPEEGPKLFGGKPRYQPGDILRVNCSSSKSKPVAQLKWMINGEPANRTFLIGPHIKTVDDEGLQTTTLGLQFKVKLKHFKRGNMKLKCLATIDTLYQLSNEESVEGEKVPRASVLESRGTVAPAGSRADRVQATGGKPQFLPYFFLVLICSIFLLVTTG